MRIAAADALAALDDVADGIARTATAMTEDRASRPLHHASHGPLPRCAGEDSARPPLAISHPVSAMNAASSASKACGVSHCGAWPAPAIVCTAPRQRVGMASEAK